jgi:hypothetical protein
MYLKTLKDQENFLPKDFVKNLTEKTAKELLLIYSVRSVYYVNIIHDMSIHAPFILDYTEINMLFCGLIVNSSGSRRALIFKGLQNYLVWNYDLSERKFSQLETENILKEKSEMNLMEITQTCLGSIDKILRDHDVNNCCEFLGLLMV